MPLESIELTDKEEDYANITCGIANNEDCNKWISGLVVLWMRECNKRRQWKEPIIGRIKETR